jgi:hypothetical protein
MPGEPLTIRNLSPNQVLLRFRSGNSVYLGPHGVLEDVEPVEVTGNHWIEHLKERQVIAVQRAEPAGKGGRRAGSEAPAGAAGTGESGGGDEKAPRGSKRSGRST